MSKGEKCCNVTASWLSLGTGFRGGGLHLHLGFDMLFLLRLLIYLHLVPLFWQSSSAAGTAPTALHSLHLCAFTSILMLFSPFPYFLPFPSLSIIMPPLLLQTWSKDIYSYIPPICLY